MEPVITARNMRTMMFDETSRINCLEKCGARTYSSYKHEDNEIYSSRIDSNHTYICEEIAGHEGSHRGWNENYYCEWLSESSNLGQLHKSTRWSVTLGTEYTEGDLIHRYEIQLLYPPQYRPDYSWEGWE